MEIHKTRKLPIRLDSNQPYNVKIPRASDDSWFYNYHIKLIFFQDLVVCYTS